MTITVYVAVKGTRASGEEPGKGCWLCSAGVSVQISLQILGTASPGPAVITDGRCRTVQGGGCWEVPAGGRTPDHILFPPPL